MQGVQAKQTGQPTALCQCAPVSRQKARKISTVFAECNKMFVRCNPAAVGPDHSTSSMIDSHVSGIQFPSNAVPKAHRTFSPRQSPQDMGILIDNLRIIIIDVIEA